MDKISDKYNKIDITSIGDLAGEIVSLSVFFEKGSLFFVELDTATIGLCGGINTFARSKSLLQRIEPVVIAISKSKWKTEVPFSFSDNPKFPFDNFAHINYRQGTYPPTFCLSRENIKDWYAEHTLKDYVGLVAQWLRDAAKGKLVKINENDEFEPQRIHNMDKLLMRVTYTDSILEKQTKASCDFYSIVDIDGKPLAYGCEHDKTINRNAIGVRLFAGSNNVDDTWYAQYPSNLFELFEFIKGKGYVLDFEKLKNYATENVKYIYFQLALLRSVKIIGKNTRINFICFRALAQDVVSSNNNAKIEEVTILDFTDYKSAKYLSKTPDSIFLKRVCLLGCGAVGSKIAYHLFRAGISNIDFVDNDKLMPHNMCRHAISSYKPESFFANKAESIKKSLTDMFYGMPQNLKAYEEDALEYLSQDRLDKTDIIIDATASVYVMYGLDAIKFPDRTRIVRVALSEGGDVGITYLCIDTKQPLADYYMEILRESLTNDQIYHWLSSERKNSTENIRVGEGCHSNTMRIGDDTISAHAAIMSAVIRHIYESENGNRIILSFAHRDYPGSMQTCMIHVKSYLQFPCANDSIWKIRIPKDLLDEIHLQAKISGKKENGGYLFGHIDYKRHIIYPLNHYMPSDSKGTALRFRLGTNGLKNYKKNIAQRSIGQMEYIGDWHSHPVCSMDMSTIDMSTCSKDVLPQLKNGIGLCVITKSNDTKFFLLSK